MSDNINNTNPPSEPLTREEEYLSAIAGVTSEDDIPEKPLTRVEKYLNKILEDGGGSVYDKLEAGTNINIEETADGKAKISATGEVSSEDTYAREQIAEHIADKDNPHEVSAADVGLGNCDNTSDLNKPISTATQTALNLKADKTELPEVPITIVKVNNEPLVPASGAVNITVPTTAADVSALPASTKYAAALSLTINSSTFVMTGQLKDQNGDNLGTAQTIDLPLESVVVGGSYNSQTKKVVLTLQNGNTIEFSVADLVSGLQTELSASNKLNPAYINYDSTHRAVSDTEKSTWNSKQNAIDSSHKLSADLVDDTSTTNKFATAAELEQIETNKNNISWANNYGYKNLINVTRDSIKAANPNLSWTDYTVANHGGLSFTVNPDLSITISGTTTSTSIEFNILRRTDNKPLFKEIGNYRIDGKIQSGKGMLAANRTVSGAGVRYGADEGATATFDVSQSDLSAPVGIWYGINEGVGVSVDMTIYPMICLSTMDRTYQPYCPSNYELYQMILNL